MILLKKCVVLLKIKKQKKNYTNMYFYVLLYISVHAASEFNGCSSAWWSHMEAGEEELARCRHPADVQQSCSLCSDLNGNF